eukprot:3938447-Pyramimonas_sp.AAC.1
MALQPFVPGTVLSDEDPGRSSLAPELAWSRYQYLTSSLRYRTSSLRIATHAAHEVPFLVHLGCYS